MSKQIEKVIVFGAGLGGESFIQHNPDLNVIAITDNNSKLWGTELNNIQIINPKDINNYDFDKVAIASQWIDSIENQLISELNIDKAKIHIPPKSQIKKVDLPFQHPKTLEFAHQAIGIISEFLKSKDIVAIADSGTALGIVRDGDFIAWDDDIDLAIHAKSFDKLIEITPKLLNLLPKSKYGNWEATVISLANVDACINLNFNSQDLNQIKDIEISLQKRSEINGRSTLDSSAGLFDAPAEHFQQGEPKEFFGYQIYLPNKVEEFLTFMYGNWREPKSTTNLQEYENRNSQVIDSAAFQISKRKIEQA